jgi:hypothetical protein
MAQQQASATTQTPSDKDAGLMTFFDPQAVCNSTSGPKRLLNEALLFHEGLHGYTGIQDGPLLHDFGQSPPSYNITYYINTDVLGGSLRYLNDQPNTSGALQCPTN